MFKTKKVDEFGGQTGNEDQTEEVVITEEKIIGDDGIERIITKKTTTKRIVQTQQVTQGAKVTTTKRTVFTSDGKELPEEFKNLNIKSETKKQIKGKNTSGSSSSSSSEDEGIAQKVKSFFKGSKSSKDQKKEHSAIKGVSPKSPSHSANEPSSKPTDDDKEFAEECLKWHNYYREKHGVKPLKLSSKLNEYAKEWATQIAKRDIMEHRPHNIYGENIFMKWSSNPSFKIAGRDPVDNWYAEIKDHVFGKEPTSLKSGHFTQVIWKGSEELGVAKARTSTGKILVVANYSPAGNMMGDFAANVPPAK
jgi:uncharacterized protein YkwD